jgi:hypothetical protein
MLIESGAVQEAMTPALNLSSAQAQVMSNPIGARGEANQKHACQNMPNVRAILAYLKS